MPKRTQLKKMKGRKTKFSRTRKSQKLNKMKGGTKKRKTSASKKRKSLKMRGGSADNDLISQISSIKDCYNTIRNIGNFWHDFQQKLNQDDKLCFGLKIPRSYMNFNGKKLVTINKCTLGLEIEKEGAAPPTEHFANSLRFHNENTEYEKSAFTDPLPDGINNIENEAIKTYYLIPYNYKNDIDAEIGQNLLLNKSTIKNDFKLHLFRLFNYLDIFNNLEIEEEFLGFDEAPESKTEPKPKIAIFHLNFNQGAFVIKEITSLSQLN